MLRFRDRSGRKRHYTPDFKVWRTNGQIELHEVTLEARRQSGLSMNTGQNGERAARTEGDQPLKVYTSPILL